MVKTVVASGKAYNDDPYDAVSNPFGLAAGGHRQNSNFIQMLLDVLADASSSLQDTSVTSLTIGTGSKVFTLANNRSIPAGVYCFAIDAANSANSMFGQVVSHTADQLTIDVTFTQGSGTISDWTIQPTGPQGVTGQNGQDGANGADGTDGAEYWNAPTFINHTDSTPSHYEPADRDVVFIDSRTDVVNVQLVGGVTRVQVTDTYGAGGTNLINIYPPTGEQFLDDTVNDPFVINGTEVGATFSLVRVAANLWGISKGAGGVSVVIT